MCVRVQVTAGPPESKTVCATRAERKTERPSSTAVARRRTPSFRTPKSAKNFTSYPFLRKTTHETAHDAHVCTKTREPLPLLKLEIDAETWRVARPDGAGQELHDGPQIPPKPGRARPPQPGRARSRNQRRGRVSIVDGARRGWRGARTFGRAARRRGGAAGRCGARRRRADPAELRTVKGAGRLPGGAPRSDGAPGRGAAAAGELRDLIVRGARHADGRGAARPRRRAPALGRAGGAGGRPGVLHVRGQLKHFVGSLAAPAVLCSARPPGQHSARPAGCRDR